MAYATDKIVRTDSFVESEPGIRISVREVRHSTNENGRPVLLIHGARVPGVASFDLPVEVGSLAADLARKGLRVFVLDIRGYGHSTRGPEFSMPPEGRAPLVRSNEAVRDIDAVVREIRRRADGQRIALLGWATGGHWAGYYATLHSDQLSRIVLLNTIYGVDAPQKMVGRGSDLEDPKHAGRFNYAAVGAYRCSSAASLTAAWDRSIPVEDKDSWRNPAVLNAYVKAALESDSESLSKSPPCFRAPSGALEDSFYSATGRQFWDASLITVPVFIVAGELDFWSRPQDRETMHEHLVHAPNVKVLVIPQATHFVFLDRPEHGRDQFIDAVVSFLNE